MSISGQASPSPYPPPAEAWSYLPTPQAGWSPAVITPVMQPPQFRTKEGVKYLTRALVTPLLVSILLLPMLLLFVLMWGSLGGVLFAVAFVALAITVVSLVIMIFVYFLKGLKRFHDGRKEFGPAHERDVGLALLFFLVAFIVTISGEFYSRTYPYWALYDYDFVYNSTKVIRATFLSLTLFYLVRDFGVPEMMKLRLGMILLILGPLVLAIPSLLTGNAYYYYYYSSATFTLFGVVISLTGCFVFWRCYKSIYAKMEAGEIRPVPPYPGFPSPVQLPYPTNMP